jgi:hypothetical protein
LASFLAGLAREVGKEVKFQNPQDLSQDLTIALTVKRRLNKKGLPKIFMQNSISRLGSQPGRTTGNLPKGIAQRRGAKPPESKEVCARSREAGNHLYRSGHPTQVGTYVLRMRRACAPRTGMPHKAKTRENAERPRKEKSECTFEPFTLAR